MKRVCFVLTSPFAVNGFMLNHFRVLSERYQLTLLVNTKEYPLSVGIDARVRVIHLDINRKISPLDDLKTLWCLGRFFQRERFDLVHSLTPKAGLLAMLAARVVGIENRLHTFTGQVWATRRGFSRWLLRLMDKLIVGASTAVFADSLSQVGFLQEEGVIAPGAARVAGPGSISGVDAARFKPDDALRRQVRDDLSIPKDAFVFLSLGRITKDKGIVELAQAFSSLVVGGVNAWLIVAGPDEGGLAEQISADAVKVMGRVKLVPCVVCAEAYLAASDVLVMPSYREGFGTVVLEAAAVGLPTIATRIYGLRDAVLDHVTGLLVPVRDVSALEGAMKIMYSDSVTRLRMGREARDRALNIFSSDMVSGAWLAEYQVLMSA